MFKKCREEYRYTDLSTGFLTDETTELMTECEIASELIVITTRILIALSI